MYPLYATGLRVWWKSDAMVCKMENVQCFSSLKSVIFHPGLFCSMFYSVHTNPISCENVFMLFYILATF